MGRYEELQETGALITKWIRLAESAGETKLVDRLMREKNLLNAELAKHGKHGSRTETAAA